MTSAFIRSSSLNARETATEDALERKFSAPKDFFPTLEALTDEELHRCITSDDAFDQLLASTSAVRESTTFTRDLAREIATLCDGNESLLDERASLASARAVVRSGDHARALRAHERASREVMKRTANAPTNRRLAEDARARARELEEAARAETATARATRGALDRDHLERLVERLLDRTERAHRLKLIAALVDDS